MVCIAQISFQLNDFWLIGKNSQNNSLWSNKEFGWYLTSWPMISFWWILHTIVTSKAKSFLYLNDMNMHTTCLLLMFPSCHWPKCEFITQSISPSKPVLRFSWISLNFIFLLNLQWQNCLFVQYLSLKVWNLWNQLQKFTCPRLSNNIKSVVIPWKLKSKGEIFQANVTL